MRVVTDRETFVETARDAPEGARVPVEVRVAVPDPFEAYLRCRTESEEGVYLETTGGQEGWGYFGVDPVYRVQVGSDHVRVAERSPEATPDAGGDGENEAFDAAGRSGTLAELRGLLDRWELVRGPCTVPYPCGAVGMLSYDVARELESIPEGTRDERGLPRLVVGVYDALAAWEAPVDDEVTLRITACPAVEDPDRAYDRGRRRALELARTTSEGDPAVGPAPVDAEKATFEGDCTEAEFAERVRRVKEYVRDGDTFQANVSQRLRAPAVVHPAGAFRALREVNPAPYSALLELRGLDLVSASPELLLDVEGDRLLTEPIAGTRPRGDADGEDAALERELRSDGKERAEHAMLVDLERNDLGKVSEYGSVEVPEYRRVDRYSEVMHLVSLVRGRLRDDLGVADAVAATFPGGTITGAPKPRTMEIIEAVEDTRRGPYTGSVCLLGFDGRATLNIVIRTLTRHGGEYHLRVGAGVVHDSDPRREYRETLDKARALVAAIDRALDGPEVTVAGGGSDPGSGGDRP